MPLPRKMLELTLVAPCTVGCEYCPQDTLAAAYKGPQLMSVKTFNQIIRHADTDTHIVFAGFGEPMLHPMVYYFLGVAIAKRGKCQINTNANCLTFEDANRLNGIIATGSLVVSLHLPKKRSAYCRQVADSIDAAVKKEVSYPVSRAGSLYDRPEHVGAIVCTRSPRLLHTVVMPDGMGYLCCCDYGLRHPIGDMRRPDNYYCARERIAQNNYRHNGNTICRRCEWAALVDGSED